MVAVEGNDDSRRTSSNVGFAEAKTLGEGGYHNSAKLCRI